MGILVVEYIGGGRVVSDFGLEGFVEDVKSIIEGTPIGTHSTMEVSSWIAFQRLRLSVLRGEIEAKKLLFAFRNSVGELDDIGQVEWDHNPRGWPRGCGDVEIDIISELLCGQIKACKEKRND